MAPAPAPWAVLGDALWCLGLGCLLAAARDALRLALKDRRHLAVTGVSRVISCDENTAVLETPLGNLTIGGQELQIGELSTQSGQVQLSGKIEYLQYAENQQSGGSLLARLFR